MDLETFLALMGCKTLDEAGEKIRALNTFVTDLRTATNESTNEGVLRSVNSSASAVRELEATTGKKGVAALGALSTMKDTAGKAEALTTELNTLKAASADAGAKTLLDDAVKAGRLEPAKREKLENGYKKHGAEWLEAAVDSLPQATARTPGEQPPTQPANTPEGAPKPGATGAATQLERDFMKASGKSLEEVRAAQSDWAKDQSVIDGESAVTFRPRTGKSLIIETGARAN